MAAPQAHAFDDLRNTLSACLRVVRQRWRLALIGLSIVGSAAFWGSQYLPREYTATTIFERRDDAVLQNLIQSNSPYSFGHLKNTLTTDMIGSRALARAAVATGLLSAETVAEDGPLSDAERGALDGALGCYELRAAVNLLQSSASLDTIQLTCTANDPAIARRFVTALRDNYIASTRERIRKILLSTRDFFQSELARLQGEFGAADEGLRQRVDDFPGLDPTDAVAVGNRLEGARAERAQAQQRKAEFEAQIAAREEFLVAAPAFYARQAETGEVVGGVAPAVATEPAAAALENAIMGVKAQLVELVTGRRMTMEHPEVKRLLGKLEGLEDLRRAMAENAPALGAPASQPALVGSAAGREWHTQQMRVEMELDSLRRQLAAATKQAAEADGRVAQLTGMYDQLAQTGDALRRLREKRSDRAVEIGLWQSHLASLERVLTAESGQRGTQFSLIEEPKDATVPSKPRISSVFVVCAGLGLAAAAIGVALAELFDRSFRSMGQVTRALGIPVLARIGVIATPQERRRVARSRLVWAPVLCILLALLAGTAGLAYASLARPDLHQRAVQRWDRLLGIAHYQTVAADRWVKN
jgi:uncharacterized protein involved in exopolysaccharide biosynthesis